MPAVTDTELRMVGTVTRPHGVRGALKVRPETDDPSRFERLEAVYLGKTNDHVTAFRIAGVAFQPMKSGVAVLLELDGIDSREAAEALHGVSVWARESDLPPLEDGEVFLSDLVGVEVRSVTGKVLGTVEDVLEFPAHPALAVRRTSGEQALVPLVPDLVPEIDLDGGYLTVAELEGLIEGEAASERD